MGNKLPSKSLLLALSTVFTALMVLLTVRSNEIISIFFFLAAFCGYVTMIIFAGFCLYGFKKMGSLEKLSTTLCIAIIVMVAVFMFQRFTRSPTM